MSYVSIQIGIIRIMNPISEIRCSIQTLIDWQLRSCIYKTVIVDKKSKIHTIVAIIVNAVGVTIFCADIDQTVETGRIRIAITVGKVQHIGIYSTRDKCRIRCIYYRNVPSSNSNGVGS